jgi:mannosyltransferase
VSRQAWITRYWWLGAVALAVGVPGSIRLGAKGLWHDEAYTVAMDKLALPTFWKAVFHQESFTALYYLVLRPWRFLGDGEVWLRVPSVTFGILAACVLFALNRKLFGARVAAIATALLAVDTFFIRYQQEVRAYSLAVLGVVVATYLFVIAVERPSTGRWVAYGVSATLAIYAHPFAGFVVAAHVGTLLIRRPPVRFLLVGYGLVAALTTPLLVLLALTRTVDRGARSPGLGSLEWVFLELTGGAGVTSRGSRLLLLGYFVVCCLAVVWMAMIVWRPDQDDRSRRGLWASALVVGWLVIPVIGMFGVSMFRPVVLPRYLIVALPALVTIAALGIAAVPSRVFQGIVVGALVLLSLPWLLSYYRADSKEGEDWRSAVTDVVDAERSGDGVVFLSRFGRRPFEYYFERLHGEADLIPIYPAQPWGGYTPVLADRDFPSAALAAPELQATYQRVWVILLWQGYRSPNEGGAALQSALDAGYHQVSYRSYGRFLRVALFERE